MCKETGVKLDKQHCYQLVPKLVKTSQEGRIVKQHVQTDRNIPINKPHIIIRYNKKRLVCANRYCNFGRQKCDKERSREDCKT